MIWFKFVNDKVMVVIWLSCVSWFLCIVGLLVMIIVWLK